MPVRVHGFAEMNRALRRAERDIRVETRAELRNVAEPIRTDAEKLAVENIRRIGPKWSRMRTGMTTNVVYVAPRERGVKRKGDFRRRRPNLAGLMMDRAMQPALERHEHEIDEQFGHALNRITNRFGQ